MKTAINVAVVSMMIGGFVFVLWMGLSWALLIFGETVFAAALLLNASTHSLQEGEAAIVSRPERGFSYDNFRVYWNGPALCLPWLEQIIRVTKQMMVTVRIGPEDNVQTMSGQGIEANFDITCGITDAKKVPYLVEGIARTRSGDINAERVQTILKGIVESALRTELRDFVAPANPEPDLLERLNHRITRQICTMCASVGLSSSTQVRDVIFHRA